MSEASDAELVDRYRNGDNASFGVILERYKNSVYSYIRSLTKGNYVLTEEIFQETFIKAIMAIRDNQYEDKGKMYSWLCITAYRLLVDHYRAEKRENIDLFDELQEYPQDNEFELSIEDQIVREQVIQDAVRLIDYLPTEQQVVIRLRFFDGLSFKEIAEYTNVSINTALGRMRYAIKNMRKMASEFQIWADA